MFEDEKPQQLKSFTAQSDLPLSIGILLDTSLSQERVLPDEQKAASAFLRRILRPTDEAFLISFDVTVDLLADWTSNPDDLKRALDAAQINSSSGNYANGTLPSITKPKGTLLYDAVYLASNDKLRQESGRKAMVLLTDGQDEGSDEKLQSAIEAAQKADAVVYVLLISDSGIYGTLDFSSDGAMRKAGGSHRRRGISNRKEWKKAARRVRRDREPDAHGIPGHLHSVERGSGRKLSAYPHRLPAEWADPEGAGSPRLLRGRALMPRPIHLHFAPPLRPDTLGAKRNIKPIGLQFS